MACYASGYWLNAAEVALEFGILMSTNKEEWGIRTSGDERAFE